MPPAAAAAISPWRLARLVLGMESTRPCCPPSCPAMLSGRSKGWFRHGGAPGTAPATAEASCWADSKCCNTGEVKPNKYAILHHGNTAS